MFSATASGVSDALSRLLFLNEGHVSSSQRFALHTVTAVYNEEYSYNGDGGNRCGSTLDAKSTGNQWRMQLRRSGAPCWQVALE